MVDRCMVTNSNLLIRIYTLLNYYLKKYKIKKTQSTKIHFNLFLDCKLYFLRRSYGV